MPVVIRLLLFEEYDFCIVEVTIAVASGNEHENQLRSLFLGLAIHEHLHTNQFPDTDITTGDC